MKTVLYYLFLLSGILPAAVLLLFSLNNLPNVWGNTPLEKEDFIVLVSCLFGICGFVGLLRLIGRQAKRNDMLTIVLLLLGIAASAIFVISIGGPRAMRWIITMQEPGACVFIVWPSIVGLTFVIILLLKRMRKDRVRKIK